MYNVPVAIFSLIDYLIHIDTISMELAIFKGLSVKFSLK